MLLIQFQKQNQKLRNTIIPTSALRPLVYWKSKKNLLHRPKSIALA